MSIKEKLANGLDGLVGFFSPKAGLKRRMFREAIKLSDKFGAYRGAEKTECVRRGFRAGDPLIKTLFLICRI